jgi:PII-like signaling protein
MGVNGHCEHGKFMCGSENLKMGVRGATNLMGIVGYFGIHTLMAIPMIRKKKKG